MVLNCETKQKSEAQTLTYLKECKNSWHLRDLKRFMHTTANDSGNKHMEENIWITAGQFKEI